MSAVELSFTPVDNQRLSNLCGVMDENLKQIESALEVSIARRCNGSRRTVLLRDPLAPDWGAGARQPA